MGNAHSGLLRVAAGMVVVAVAAAGCGRGGDTPADAGVDVHAAPVDVTWSPVGGIAVPRSAVSGPRDVDGQIASGYEHSPQGAALAAINGSIRLGVADDASWARLLRSAVAPGVARDEWAVARAQVERSAGAVADPAKAPRVTGYRIDPYSDTEATVQVVTEFPDTSVATTEVRLLWRGEDWLLVLPAAAEGRRTVTAGSPADPITEFAAPA